MVAIIYISTFVLVLFVLFFIKLLLINIWYEKEIRNRAYTSIGCYQGPDNIVLLFLFITLEEDTKYVMWTRQKRKCIVIM